MRALRSVVCSLVGDMFYRRAQLTERNFIRSKFVGGDAGRRQLSLQKFAYQLGGGRRIAARLDQEIQKLTTIVHRSAEPVTLFLV